MAALLARAFRILRPPIQAVLAADANIYLPPSAPAEDLATVGTLVAAIPGVLEVEAVSSTAAYDEARAALAGSAAAEVVPQPLAPLVHVFAPEEVIVRVRAALADAVPDAVVQTRAELLAERDSGAGPVENQLRLVSGAMAALSTSGPAELQEAALALTSPTLSSSADVEALRPHADVLVRYATETCGIPTVR